MIREPRIVLVFKEKKIESMHLVRKDTILNTFEQSESLSNVFVYLYAYYFCLNIPYPEKFEIVLGFFHETLGILDQVVFTKSKSRTYSKLIVNLKSLLKQ